MKGYRVQYAADAMEDLRSIYHYIAHELQAPQATQGQVDRIRKMIRSLENAPTRFLAVNWEPWHKMGMRKVPVDRYMVFYLVDEPQETVTVVRIFYCGRNIREIIREIL